MVLRSYNVSRSLPNGWKPKAFVLDVDGVMTTGQFLYSNEGKAYKVFGPDDNDGLAMLRDILTIQFVSADKRGLSITHKRIVEDMRYPLALVGSMERATWIAARFPMDKVVYMGDGIFDRYTFPRVAYAICPSDGFYLTRESADYVTRSPGGNRAVAEACLHLLDRFFSANNPQQQLPSIEAEAAK